MGNAWTEIADKTLDCPGKRVLKACELCPRNQQVEIQVLEDIVRIQRPQKLPDSAKRRHATYPGAPKRLADVYAVFPVLQGASLSQRLGLCSRTAQPPPPRGRRA